MLLDHLVSPEGMRRLKSGLSAIGPAPDDLDWAAGVLKERFPGDSPFIDILMADLKKRHRTSPARAGWGPLALYGYVGQPVGRAVERARALADALNRPLVEVDLAGMPSDEIESLTADVKRIGPKRPVLLYRGLEKCDAKMLRALAGVAHSEAWNGSIAVVATSAGHQRMSALHSALDQNSDAFQGNSRALLIDAGMPGVVVASFDLVFAFRG